MSVLSLPFPASLATKILGSEMNLLCGLLTHSSSLGSEHNILQF